MASKVGLARLEILGTPGALELLVQMDLVLLALLELLEYLVLSDLEEILDHLGLTEHLGILELLEQVSKATMVPPVQLDLLDRQVLLVTLVHLDFKVLKDEVESWVFLVHWEILVFKVLDSLDNQAKLDHKDHRDELVSLEQQETLDHPERQE